MTANSVVNIPISTTDSFYVASDIKPRRSRRTKAAVTGIRTAIIDILSKDNPQTVRQVFYALTVRGVITKAEIEYQRTVVRLLGEIPGAEIHFERPAVTRAQVEEWTLPTRPTKQ